MNIFAACWPKHSVISVRKQTHQCYLNEKTNPSMLSNWENNLISVISVRKQTHQCYLSGKTKPSVLYQCENKPINVISVRKQTHQCYLIEKTIWSVLSQWEDKPIKCYLSEKHHCYLSEKTNPSVLSQWENKAICVISVRKQSHPCYISEKTNTQCYLSEKTKQSVLCRPLLAGGKPRISHVHTVYVVYFHYICLWLDYISFVEITLFLLVDIWLPHGALFQC